MGSSEPAPPSKSAIKRAKAQARIERKQQEKAARAAARLQAKANGDLVPPIDSPASSVTPLDSPALAPKALEEETSLPKPKPHAEPPTLVNGDVRSEAPSNRDAHSVPPSAAQPRPAAPPSQPVSPPPVSQTPSLNGNLPPLSPKEAALSLPEQSRAQRVEKQQPVLNGAVELSKVEAARPEDAEKAKKRQNVLTRTLWSLIMIGGFLSRYQLNTGSLVIY